MVGCLLSRCFVGREKTYKSCNSSMSFLGLVSFSFPTHRNFFLRPREAGNADEIATPSLPNGIRMQNKRQFWQFWETLSQRKLPVPPVLRIFLSLLPQRSSSLSCRSCVVDVLVVTEIHNLYLHQLGFSCWKETFSKRRGRTKLWVQGQVFRM